MNECQFEPCHEPAISRRPNFPKGLCKKHYMQDYKYGKVYESANYNTVKDGMKVCPKCEVNRPVDDYYKRRAGQLCAYCKECMKELSRQQRARNAEKARQGANKKNVADDATQI